MARNPMEKILKTIEWQMIEYKPNKVDLTACNVR